MHSIQHNLSLASRGIRNFFLHKPLSVSFEVTYRCNARCKHCHLGGPVKEHLASPQTYGDICRKIQPVLAQISGGEPLLRKDLEQIIEAVRVPNRAPFIVVTTNGVLLNIDRYQSLRRAGVDEFSLSLDYPDERHDEFRRVPGLFKRIKNLMEDLDSNDKAITLSCVVQRDNFRDLLKIAELATQWNVKINFSTYTWLRTDDKDYIPTQEDLPELVDITNKLIALRKKNKNIFASEYIFKRMIEFFKNGDIPNCQAGKKFFIVNQDGTYSPCGLIIKNYKSPDDILDFVKNNQCGACNTSIRANCEKPVKYLIKDNIGIL